MSESRPTAIYARVSTQVQVDKGESLDDQVAACRRRCAEMGWPIVGEFIEKGESGKDLNRPALDRLTAAIEAGEVKRVVVWKMDRMERDLLHQLEREAMFKAYGVELVVTEHQHDTSTPEGALMSHVLGAFAEHERRIIRKRLEDGQLARAKAGKWPAGAPPYGFRLVPSPDGKGKIVELDPAKVAVIERVVSDYLADRTLRAISDELIEDGVPAPRKGEWTSVKLRKVLGTGVRSWGGSWIYGRAGSPIPIAMPRILDDETIRRVAARLEDRTFVRGTSAVYPLAMRITSPCGSHLIGRRSREKRRYICAARREHGPGHCDCVQTDSAAIEEASFLAVSKFLSDRSAIQALISQKLDGITSITGKAATSIAALTRRIDETEARIGQEAIAMRDECLSPKSIAAGLRPLSLELETLMKLRDETSAAAQRTSGRLPSELAAWVADDYSDWDSASLEVRRAMFVEMDVRVSVTGWMPCGECGASGWCFVGFSGLDSLGRNHARTVGCDTCSTTGMVPVISVAGCVPAELLDSMASVTEISGGGPVGDLNFSADVA